MIFVRLIVAFASVYIYNFLLDKLKDLPPVKWLPNNSMTGLILNAIGLIIFFGVLLWPFYKEAKMRTSELKKIAIDMGFVFHDGTFQPAPSLLQSPLLRRGFRRSFGPAITGKHEGVEILLFEHVYSDPGESSDREDRRYLRTVVVFYAPELDIPEFVMIAKGLGDRMAEALFGNGNIDFKGDSKFSKRYALSGKNQEFVRALFVPDLRSTITGSEKRWAAAGIDNKLMLFADNERDEQLKPEEFVDYLEKTWEIFNVIRSKNRL